MFKSNLFSVFFRKPRTVKKFELDKKDSGCR